MARKAVLEGGKRDEILAAARDLFLEKGYDATSVRMILDRVGGEVGMFYHYFKSKEELFQQVVERFFRDYRLQLVEITEGCDSPEEFFRRFLAHLGDSMKIYHGLSGNMHWTVQYAMSARTALEMKPAIMELIKRWGCRSEEPADIVAGQLLFGISGTLHSPSFERMSEEERWQPLMDLAQRLL